jgi:hypothetical protein
VNAIQKTIIKTNELRGMFQKSFFSIQILIFNLLWPYGLGVLKELSENLLFYGFKDESISLHDSFSALISILKAEINGIFEPYINFVRIFIFYHA